MNKKIRDLIEYPSDGILSKIIFKSDIIEATLFCMSRGTEISEHTSTKNGIVYVIEGKGIFNLEGKAIPMEEGLFLYLKQDTPHSLKVEENTSFLLILIKQGDKNEKR